MFVVEVYAAVRQFVFNDGKSRREAARVFGLSRETVSKMCRFSMPPGYVRQRPAAKPKLGPLIPVSLSQTLSCLAVDRESDDFVVLNCWVTETNETPWASNSSTSLAKSASDLVKGRPCRRR
jgi:DNA-binding transcriptional regulator LsrR (DeoR family)